MKYAFVVLHYIVEKDTVECVESIRKTFYNEDYSIVVVDNGSPNDSGIRLKDRYKSSFDVHVILSNNNLGFARGNNLGFDYCKYKLNAKYIIICNNDILFKQYNFLKRIESIYQKERYDVLGPDIIDLVDKEHTSPIALHPYSLEILKRETNKLLLIQILTSNDIIEAVFKYLLKVKHMIFGKPVDKKTEKINREAIHYNCILQGSCIVFSEKYIYSHLYAFYPETFLYFEEYILSYIVNRENGKVIYYPEVQVIHKGHVSTNITLKNKNKERFGMKQQNESRKVLINLMKKDIKNN